MSQSVWLGRSLYGNGTSGGGGTTLTAQDLVNIRVEMDTNSTLLNAMVVRSTVITEPTNYISLLQELQAYLEGGGTGGGNNLYL